jgi:nitrite reductase/ring-hydroxylating ferredoxin subunit
VSLVRLDGPGVVTSNDGRTFAVFADAGGYRVTDALCPHNKGPLDQGWLRSREGQGRGATVTCPWHWYRFDLETGECDASPRHRLGVYPVLERDGAWFADVGEPAAALSWAERLRAHARGDT